MVLLARLWAGYKKHRLVVRMVYAVIGVAIGCSACIVFAHVFDNFHAAFWAVASAAFAAMYFKTNLKVRRDKQRLAPVSFFTLIKWMGFIGCLAGIVGFITYIILGVKHHEKDVDGYGYFIVTVWNFMTFKWGIVTLIGARNFERMYSEDSPYEGIVNS